MANKLYRQKLRAEIVGLLSTAEAAASTSHMPTRGTIREEALRQLLAKYLPHGCSVGHGLIVDVADKESAQTDAIVYANQLLAPALHSTDEGYFPIDACIFAIEIKSRLTSNELDSSIRNADRLKRMRYSEPIVDNVLLDEYPPVATLLFAFDSDLTGPLAGELTRYASKDPSAFIDPLIPILCVANKGMWDFRYGKRMGESRDYGAWHVRGTNDWHDEIIDFFGLIINTVSEIVAARGKPRLGQYIIQPRPYKRYLHDGGELTMRG